VARRDGGRRAMQARSMAAFVAGWLAVVVALLSPLDDLADSLFAAHMVQHLVLIMIAAPLLVIGAPPVSWLWLLPRASRRAVGRWWLRSRARLIAAPFTHPPAVLAAHIFAVWLWHFPKLYEAAIRSSGLHALEHLSFLGTAVLFWWVVLHPTGRRTLGYGASILYVGVALCMTGALGALLMFSSRPWYSVHAAGEQARNLTALDDQQLAGLIMWIPAGVIYVGVAVALCARWMADDARVTRLADARLDAAFAGGAER
jgi:putative membrane protein